MIVGSGTELDKLQALAVAKGLQDHVTFTGFLAGDTLLAALSSFDVGVIPDPKNIYNDKISMNKAFEYMTLGIPFVQFDLVEGRNIAGDAALYAADNSVSDLARQIGRLCDDEALAIAIAKEGQARAKALLQWDEEARQLLAAYDAVLRPDAAQEHHAPGLSLSRH